jgi:hypothetical protein
MTSTVEVTVAATVEATVAVTVAIIAEDRGGRSIAKPPPLVKGWSKGYSCGIVVVSTLENRVGVTE